MKTCCDGIHPTSPQAAHRHSCSPEVFGQASQRGTLPKGLRFSREHNKKPISPESALKDVQGRSQGETWPGPVLCPRQRGRRQLPLWGPMSLRDPKQMRGVLPTTHPPHKDIKETSFTIWGSGTSWECQWEGEWQVPTAMCKCEEGRGYKQKELHQLSLKEN